MAHGAAQVEQSCRTATVGGRSPAGAIKNSPAIHRRARTCTCIVLKWHRNAGTVLANDLKNEPRLVKRRRKPLQTRP